MDSPASMTSLAYAAADGIIHKDDDATYIRDVTTGHEYVESEGRLYSVLDNTPPPAGKPIATIGTVYNEELETRVKVIVGWEPDTTTTVTAANANTGATMESKESLLVRELNRIQMALPSRIIMTVFIVNMCMMVQTLLLGFVQVELFITKGSGGGNTGIYPLNSTTAAILLGGILTRYTVCAIALGITFLVMFIAMEWRYHPYFIIVVFYGWSVVLSVAINLFGELISPMVPIQFTLAAFAQSVAAVLYCAHNPRNFHIVWAFAIMCGVSVGVWVVGWYAFIEEDHDWLGAVITLPITIAVAIYNTVEITRIEKRCIDTLQGRVSACVMFYADVLIAPLEWIITCAKTKRQSNPDGPAIIAQFNNGGGNSNNV